MLLSLSSPIQFQSPRPRTGPRRSKLMASTVTVTTSKLADDEEKDCIQFSTYQVHWEELRSRQSGNAAHSNGSQGHSAVYGIHWSRRGDFHSSPLPEGKVKVTGSAAWTGELDRVIRIGTDIRGVEPSFKGARSPVLIKWCLL